MKGAVLGPRKPPVESSPGANEKVRDVNTSPRVLPHASTAETVGIMRYAEGEVLFPC